MTFYLGKTVRGEKAKAWSTAVTPAWKWGRHCHQVPRDGPSDQCFCWKQATAVRQHHRAKGKTGIRCIPVYYNHTHTHPYDKLRQSKTILSMYFKWMHCGQLWALGPDLQKPYGENALPLNVDFHCTRHLNTENYSCTGASSFQCDTEKCLPRIKEISTLIPAASRLLLLSELRWHRYGDASPLEHQGTIWIDSPGAGRTAAVSGKLWLQWRLQGPMSSSTRGMRQLKEHHKQSLVGWALRPHGGTVKDLLTAEGQEDAMETEGEAVWPWARMTKLLPIGERTRLGNRKPECAKLWTNSGSVNMCLC